MFVPAAMGSARTPLGPIFQKWCNYVGLLFVQILQQIFQLKSACGK